MTRHFMVGLAKTTFIMLLLTWPAALRAANSETTAYQEQISPLLHEAMNHTDEAMHAAADQNLEGMTREVEQALQRTNQAQEFGYNERLHDAVYALADALHHGQAGELKDAHHHLEQARHALRHAVRATAPDSLEGTKPAYDRLPADARTKLDGALHRAHEANLTIDRGDAEAAQRVIDEAIRQVQPIAKEDWRLKDALKGLREARGHVEHGEIRDVKEHLQYAVMKLLEVRGR